MFDRQVRTRFVLGRVRIVGVSRNAPTKDDVEGIGRRLVTMNCIAKDADVLSALHVDHIAIRVLPDCVEGDRNVDRPAAVMYAQGYYIACRSTCWAGDFVSSQTQTVGELLDADYRGWVGG